eukprot:3933097-Rhodomonas_salina.1
MTGARDGEKAAVLIKGTAEQRAKAWELAQAVLEEDVETHEVPMEYHRLIIGPVGAVPLLLVCLAVLYWRAGMALRYIVLASRYGATAPYGQVGTDERVWR